MAAVRGVAPLTPRYTRRLYRNVHLRNGMHVMLISDPEADSGAAAMAVRVGHFSDPAELPGLAHFCEHMLFLGTEKYPEEGEYKAFLSKHGGRSNAFTSTENTTYYFDVLQEHFTQAFDRFASFFTAPLFTASATQRELEAVHSENQKNLQSDGWREFQLLKSLARPEHAFHKFGTGNLSTLKTVPEANGIDVHERVQKFFRTFYGAPVMKLAVLSRQSLDQLEEMVCGSFDGLPATPTSPPSFANAPHGPEAFPSEHLGTLVKVVPVKDEKKIKFLFPLPPLRHYTKEKPTRYISHLVGHEGPGSILHVLKEEGLATALSAGGSRVNTAFQMFSVTINVTEKGMKDVERVSSIVFDYIRLLKSSEPLKWIFDEIAATSRLDFEYEELHEPVDEVKRCVSNMLWHDDEHALNANDELSQFAPELITSVLDRMVPENLILLQISKEFAEEATCREHHYQTPYCIAPLPPAIDSLANPDHSPTTPQLHLPEANPFIPDAYDLVSPPDTPVQHPRVILEETNVKLWYSLDTSFKEPRTNFRFHLRSPVIASSARAYLSAAMARRLFAEAMIEFEYYASIAGLSLNTTMDSIGIGLYFTGLSQKMPLFIDRVFQCLSSFPTSQRIFDMTKEKMSRDLRNRKLDQPYSITRYVLHEHLTTPYWSSAMMAPELDALTLEEVRCFVQQQLLASFQLEAFAHGNIEKEAAIAVVKSVTERLGSFRPPAVLPHPRVVRLDAGTAVVPFDAWNPKNNNSAIYHVLQCGPTNTHTDCCLDLLETIGKARAFDMLRTKEQLGYIVWSGAAEAHGDTKYYVRVQSPKYDPVYLMERVECFLGVLLDLVQNMSQKEYTEYVDSLIAKKLEKDLALIDVTRKWYYEISERQYQFDREQSEVAFLKALHKEEFVSFVEGLLRPEDRRAISIQLFGADHPMDLSKYEERSDVSVVSCSADAFKMRLPLQPAYQ